MVAEKDVASVLSDPDARALGFSRSTLARAAVTLEVMDGEVKIPDKLAKPVLYSKESEEERKPVNVTLSAATDSIPGLKNLQVRANAGDSSAARQLNNIAFDSLSNLTEQIPSAKIERTDNAGLYFGELEPSLGLRVSFNAGDKSSVLASLAKFADNFNQHQIHVRQDTNDKAGTVYPDGSFATPEFSLKLKNPLSREQVQDIVEKSGLVGLSYNKGELFAYYIGAPNDRSAIEQFTNNFQSARDAAGDNAEGVTAKTSRLWAYGNGDVNGEPVIPYSAIDGDISTRPAQANKTANRVAEDVAGRPVTPAEQKDITEQQGKLQRRIRDAYEAMPMNDLGNPDVRHAYDALGTEVKHQFEKMPAKVEIWHGNDEPYKNSQAMRQDIQDNNHLYIYATDADHFGPPGIEYKNHPLLEQSGMRDINGIPLLYNDLLRAVHDYYAHTLSPVAFGPKGEEAAWKNHVEMTNDPWARWALTSETRGQNSWVNFRDGIQDVPLKERGFGEQKVGLLPIEFAMSGTKQDASMRRLADQIGADRSRGSVPDGWEKPDTSEQFTPAKGAVNYGTPTDGSVQAVGHHFSTAQRSNLNSDYFGTGLKGLERERLSDPANSDIKSRLNFYVDKGQGVHPEFGVGSVEHQVNLNNLYDTRKDPLGLIKNAKGVTSADRSSHWERAIRKAGYDGYLADTGGHQAFAVLIGKHNIDMSGNKLSREKDDLFQDDFANKKTTVDTGIKISSNGETLKGGNVDSEGRQITATKQGLKNFWNWFGESEATDDSGKPMVLYHSTNADTNVLKDGQKTTNNYGFLGDVELSRSGIFLSPDRNFSQEYLRDGEGKNVMPLYARLEKPLDLRSGMTPEVENELVDAGINRRWLFDYRQHDWEMFDNADDGTNHFVDTLKRLGYDGAIFNEEGQDEKSHETYVAFDGSQLKSATGNKGTFDGSSSDIRQSREEDVPLSTRRIMESDDKDARASLGLNTDNSGRQANDVRSIAHTLNGKTLAEHGPMNDQSPTPGDSDRIASAMADEVHWQVAHSPKEDTGTGLGWYSHNYPNAVRKLSRRFPELATNEHAQSVFTALVAITSNGEKVAINIQNAIDLYSKLRVGKELVGVGSRRAGALENNLAQLERLLSVHGDGLKQHLLEVTTVGDMNKMLRAMGEKPDGSYTADTEVPRAAIYFGPKLGAFYANLSGSEGYLTMDLWWSRSINRMRGLLIPKATDASIGKFRDIMSSPDASREEVVQSTKPLRDQYKQQGWTTELEHLAKGKEPSKKDEKEAWFSAAKKAAGDGYEQLLFEHNAQKMANTIYKNEFDMLAEAPFRATDRDFMYESARKAQSILDDKGVKLSLADIQAALWYYEKRLYQKLSGRKADDIGYEEAINQQASASNRPERPSVVFAAKPDGGTDSAAAGGKTDQVQQHAEDGEPKLSREQEVEGRENEHPGLVSNLIHYSLEDLVDKAGDKTGVYDTLAPMSSGTQRTRALAQQWINKSRTAEWGWSKIDKAITDNFTEHQRWKMWEAADEENDYRRNGIQTDGTGRGLDSLTPQERSVVDDLHHYSVELWNRAKAIGMVQGDGVDFWTPRMMVVIGANGEYEAPSEGKQGTSEGIGKNFTTSASSTKSRKYELSTDTEAAMVAKGGALVRDIRTMPMAMAKMEKAIAGRELINQIKAIGVATGKATVSSTGGDGFFTLDHPAFKTYGPRFDENGIVLKEDGAPVIDPKPIFISNDFKGPLKAILSQNLTANKVYTGYMLLKSKAMSAIMYSPLIHNQVILGRALAYGGLRTPLLYFTGNAAKNDTAFMRKMIDSGMVPIGSHNNMLDVGDIARGNAKEGGWLDPNESWITKSLQVVGNKAKDGLGDSIKRGMDYAGDVLHNKLLWERVGDLQAGIAQDVYQKLSKKGLDDNAASTVAAHIANRYAGAIGKESMSELSHVIANITLFSKSFNAGNIGTVKDAFFGLPAGLKSQLNENSSAESAAKALNFSKNKARIGLVRDAAYAIMLTSLVQDWVKRDKNKSFGDQVSDGLEGYQKRAAQAWANAKDNPLTMSAYNPYRLSSTWGNEPNKRDRVDMGEQDGGRHEYMRLPTGKVVEDILGWTTHPWDTADKKKSPLMSALQRMRDVKDPYGTPVMDPNGSLPSKVWDMAKALVGTHMPLDQLQTAKDIAVGVGTKLDKDKMIGNITGLSYSQGNPQGPEAAVAYATADRVMAEKKYAMEYVKRDLKNGEEDAARARLEKIGLTGKEITHIINKIQNPKSHMSASQRKSFNAHATDEERADMETVGQ